MRRHLIPALLALMPPVAASASLRLVDNSPFLPPGGAPKVADPGAPQEQPSLELRGISTVGGETRFSVFNASTQQSVWLKLDEQGQDFVVRSYDEKDDSISVVQGDRTIALHLPKEQFVALAQPSAAQRRPNNQPPGMGGPPGPPGNNTQARQPTAEEQQRLEAIAAEVRRRRALRQSQPANGATQAPQTPAPVRPQGTQTNRRAN